MTASEVGLLVALTLALAPSTSRAQTEPVEALEALEGATYVVFRIEGASPEVSRDGARVTPRLDATYTAGVATAPDAVVTSARSLEGGDVWAVMDVRALERGEPAFHAATPIHVDLELDVAFLRVDASLSRFVPLPEAAAPIAPGAAVTFSGLSGFEMRRHRGTVESVETGGAMRIDLDRGDHHAGRFLTDERGRWVGIVGDEDGDATSMAGIRAAWDRRPTTTPALHPSTQLVARALNVFGHECDLGTDPEDVLAIGREALAVETPDPFADAVLATLLTRVGLCARAERGVMDAASPTELETFDVAARLARRALARSPTTRAEYLALPLLAEGWPLPRPPIERSTSTPQLGFSIVDPPPRARPRRGGWTTTVTRETRGGPGGGPGRGAIPGMGAEPPPGSPSSEPSWRRTWP